jgi:hypothetical protein
VAGQVTANSTVFTAQCRAGDVALSGGWTPLFTGQYTVLENQPSPSENGITPTGWSFAFSAASNPTVAVWVVCS